MPTDAGFWDARYDERPLLPTIDPHPWLADLTADLPPGRALEYAAGESRNSLWLVARGWRAHAVDFSGVALARARQLAAEHLGDAATRFTTEQADVFTVQPVDAYDLVIIGFLHLPPAGRRTFMRQAAAALRSDGRLLVLAHHPDNLREGIGGPRDITVHYTAADVLEDVADLGLIAEVAERRVQTFDDGLRQIDTVVLLRRPA